MAGDGSTNVPVYIGYAALCVLLLVASLLAFSVWYFKRRRAISAPDTYSTQQWNRYATVLRSMEQPTPAAVRLQRHTQHGNGITLDELDLVAPVRRYGIEDEDDKENELKSNISLQTTGKEFLRGGETAYVPDTAVSESPAKADTSPAESMCAICLDEMETGQKTRRLPCMHEYHSGCVEEWITKVNRCPVCSREPMETELIASRRNARSTRRRGIDAAIARERRRRTRSSQGRYELTPIRYETVLADRSSLDDVHEDVPEAPLPPPPQPSEEQHPPPTAV